MRIASRAHADNKHKIILQEIDDDDDDDDDRNSAS